MSPSKQTLFVIIALGTLMVGTQIVAQSLIPQRPPLIRFFTNSRNCIPASSGVPYHNFTESRNLSDLVSFQSYCVVRGLWRIELPYVQGRADYNISEGDSCTSCYGGVQTARRYGLVERIGGPDLITPFFNLYPERDFRGPVRNIYGWEFTFDDTYSFSSVAFSGFHNWTWQTYYLPRYRGNSSCFRPMNGKEVTYFNEVTLNVGSIRQGCRNSGNSVQYRDAGLIAIVLVAFTLPTSLIVL